MQYRHILMTSHHYNLAKLNLYRTHILKTNELKHRKKKKKKKKKTITAS